MMKERKRKRKETYLAGVGSGPGEPRALPSESRAPVSPPLPTLLL
jgi:hypothetical protein